jgi:hypothetical protein
MTNDVVDPRRNRPIEISWSGDKLYGRLFIDAVRWAYVEWSEKRQEWCIEDNQGRCLRHAADLRGTADTSQGAVDLATAMIRDGRMSTPEEATAQRHALSQKPANVRARQRRREQRDRSAYLGERCHFTIRSLTPSSRLKAVFHCGPAPRNVGAKSATFSRYTEVLLEHAEQGYAAWGSHRGSARSVALAL